MVDLWQRNKEMPRRQCIPQRTLSLPSGADCHYAHTTTHAKLGGRAQTPFNQTRRKSKPLSIYLFHTNKLSSRRVGRRLGSWNRAALKRGWAASPCRATARASGPGRRHPVQHTPPRSRAHRVCVDCVFTPPRNLVARVSTAGVEHIRREAEDDEIPIGLEGIEIMARAC